ncbi:dTDP-4-dehydrorhamnose reductase [Marinovum sp.]|uniref:dTDP-4-dehydrorhamnose reductase n=1 Tax=Marinovum sp. TaxID=2024839 RepID=UPI003A91AAE6
MSGTILVFGRSGQVAQELLACPPEGRQVVALGRDALDLADPGCDAAIAAAVEAHAPVAVINAAAYTAVDRAEAEEAQAQQINATASGAMARTCAARGIPLVQLSTDYVFDGAGETAFAPDHPAAPLGTYGRSKLAGETAVRAADGVHAILRTSWVFSAHGQNFLKTMLRLSESRSQLDVVADQIGGPTPARDIAAACLTVAGKLAEDGGKTGTYHFAGAPETSWKDFAEAIFAAAGRAVAVRGIATADYPTAAVRPLNSRLDCATLTAQFGITRPDWRAAVRDIVKELT